MVTSKVPGTTVRHLSLRCKCISELHGPLDMDPKDISRRFLQNFARQWWEV
jgi:hypothetical protein